MNTEQVQALASVIWSAEHYIIHGYGDKYKVLEKLDAAITILRAEDNEAVQALVSNAMQGRSVYEL